MATVNSISFGAKIPTTRCQILDKQKNEFIPATVYEYDCNDIEDVYEIGDLDESWQFGEDVASKMHAKYLKRNTPKAENNIHYYSLKTGNEVVSICQTQENDRSIGVKLIESSHDGKYKYAGQAMLASLGAKALSEENQTLKICGALPEAYHFYEDVCQFRCTTPGYNILGYQFDTTRDELADFVDRTESRTNGNIINLVG
ncbi:hypothetical protein IJX73_03240 [bacterium]|nr:hypothetical protein [bacterium]